MTASNLWDDPSFNGKVLLVGGAVRDKFLGIVPKDNDWVIVGAIQHDVDALYSKGFTQVGADFPVFLHPETNEEYALARVERKNGVGYNGFAVDASEHVTIEQDLARRDLTINSMAIDKFGGLVDPYGGLDDLRNKVFRHTTSAFAEDPLRVLRLARFAARYPSWTVHEDTVALCRKISASGELDFLSTERIWAELKKGFEEPSPDRMLQVLHEVGALENCVKLNAVFGKERFDCGSGVPFHLNGVASENRFTFGVVLTASPYSELSGAPTRVKLCLKNFTAMARAERTCTELMEVLKRAKAFSDGTTFDDLVGVTRAAEETGITFHTFSSVELIEAKYIAGRVKADMFPNLQGKELGEAIQARRINDLFSGMNIPSCLSPIAIQ